MFDNASNKNFNKNLRDGINKGFDDAEDSDANRALREGLYDLPTPEVSTAFDHHIQAALFDRPAWWQTLWTTSRPAIPVAVCALAGMLLLLNIAQKSPVSAPTSSSTSARAEIQKPFSSVANAQGKAPEEVEESIDLTAASTGFFTRPLHRNTHKSG